MTSHGEAHSIAAARFDSQWTREGPKTPRLIAGDVLVSRVRLCWKETLAQRGLKDGLKMAVRTIYAATLADARGPAFL